MRSTLLILAASASLASAQTFTTEVLVFSGKPTPDGTATIASLEAPPTGTPAPAIDATGGALFLARLSGTPGLFADDTALFHATPTSLTELARENTDIAAELPGRLSDLLSAKTALHPSGLAAFLSVVKGATSATNRGIFTAPPLATAARLGSPGPEPDSTLEALAFHGLTLAGDAVYSASYAGRRAIFTSAGETIVTTDALTPDGSATYTALGDTVLTNTPIPSVAFIASPGIFVHTAGHIRTVARIGAPAPVDPPANFSSFSNLFINDTGAVAFNATVSGTPGTAAFHATPDGTITAIALPGDPPPDLTPNNAIASTTLVAFNDRSESAYLADFQNLSGLPTFTALQLHTASNNATRQVVREGGTVPGGTVAALLPETIALNDTGALAFLTFLETGPGVLLYDPGTGTLTTVIREGTRVLGVPVLDIAFNGSNRTTGLTPGLNNASQLAFRLFLDDSTTAVAVASPPPPETLTYQQWATANALPPGNDAPQDDADHDGVPNILAYALPPDPRPLTITGTTVTYTASRTTTALTLLPETSPDLSSWQPLPTTIIDRTPTTTTFQAQLPPAPATYLRLRATLAP